MNEKKSPAEAVEIIPFQPSRLLICFDGSEHSKRALNTAISMGYKYGSEVIVTHAVPLPVDGYGLGDAYYAWDQYEMSARGRLEKMVEPFAEAARRMGVNLRINFLGGTVSIVETLIESSVKEKADLIVMGSRGVGGFRGLLIGSVSQGVASHSSIPVMIVK